MIFDKNKDFPYSDYRLNTKQLYDYTESKNIILEENPIITYIQTFDMFENYKILWFKDELINLLGLKIGDFNRGLYAINDENEIVLKFNQWNSEYLGNDIKGMIPSFSGSELLIRKDYFEILKTIYGKELYYLNKIIG